VTLLAISMDAPDESRAFAGTYGIRSPLLADVDGAVSRRYVGVTSDANALPGVTIIDRDGRVVFRQASSTKDDRLTAAALFAAIDRSLGTTGPTVGASGYASLERAQLRVALGGGLADGDWTGVAHVGAYVPIGRYLTIGPRVAVEPRSAPLSLEGVAMLRAPIWGDAAALELGAIGGWTPWRARGAEVGGCAGLWFAISPSWSVQLEAEVVAHGLGASIVPVGALTLGVARLVRW
jgi:hypothetical protein